jgi:hypothetical protein
MMNLDFDNKKDTILCSIIILSLIASLILLQACATANGQLETSFTPADRFNIQSLDGTISFGLNGEYSTATLANNTWVFENLRLNGSHPLNTLRVSTQNSSIIINSYQAFNTTLRAASLRYAAQGPGQQTFNIGIDAGESRLGLHPEWSVVIERASYGVWLGEGEGWTIRPDGTLTVTGVVGNVSIVYYNFMGLIGNEPDLPFYEQHSVFIATITLASITASLGAIIRIKTEKSVAPT